MAELFALGAPATESVLLGGGNCKVSLSNDETFELEVEDSLVGAEALLLQRSGSLSSTHLYGLSADESLIKRRVGATQIVEALRDFELGFTQNRFSAQVLARATAALVNIRDHLAKSQNAHEARALSFTLLILELKRWASAENSLDLISVLSPAGSAPLFELGVALRRERVFASIDVSAGRLTRPTERIRANSILCREEEEARSMYVLLEGRIAVLQRGRLVARITHPGEAFGEMALFLEGHRTATLIAETDSAVFQLYEKDVPEFHSSHLDVFINLGGTLASRLEQTLIHFERLKLPMADNLAPYSPEAIASGERAYRDLWENLKRFRSNISHPEFSRIIDNATPPMS